MSIIRLVDGKPVVFANNITDHKQLKGKDEYGCHPIQAIRNLPEKLSALKEKDTNLENSINGLNNKIESLNVSALSAKVNEVEQSVKVIDIQENENEGTFTFTNYAGKETKTIQSGYKPDNINLELNNDKTLTLKKISTDSTLKGLGIESNKLGVNIDNSTLIQNSNSKLQVIGINDGQTLLTGHFINQKLSDINKDIGNLTQTINNNKEELDQYNKTQDSRINDLYTRTTGLGGYLDANNFGTATPTQDQLTNYALQQISSAQGNRLKIYNQTKVKNLFDGNVWILTNIPDADPAIFQWANKGPESIGDANNDGIHGLVTGSYVEFEGSVDSLGHLTINGLEENINEINASLANKANLSGNNIFEGNQTYNGEVLYKTTSYSSNGQMQTSQLKITSSGLILNSKNVAQQYLSLSGESGVLDDDQYLLVTTYDDLIIQRAGVDFRRCGHPSNGEGNYIFISPFYSNSSGTEEFNAYVITIKQDKTWEVVVKPFIQVAEQTYAPIVILEPDTSTNGVLSDEDYNNLINHDSVRIKLNNEYYTLMNDQPTEGTRSYVHCGWGSNGIQTKAINITLATKAWTLAVDKNKYYRHYIQLTVDDKTLYYDFISRDENAYVTNTLPTMLDNIITPIQVLSNGYYSSVSGRIYKDGEDTIKVTVHGMYTSDGASQTYLSLTDIYATFVSDNVIGL